MLPHHQRGIDKVVQRFEADRDILGIILGGSIAKGCAREDSDIDVVLVTTDAAHRRYEAEQRLSFLLWDVCDYPKGYVDVKVATRSYLEAAAQRGSEPTRSAFVGAKVLFAREPDLPDLIARIGIYSEGSRQERIESFFSQLMLMRGYFWPHAHKSGDLYLKARSASDLVLYGYRLLLAHNRMLFPCHKSLRAAVEILPEKPDGITDLADTFLAEQSEESMVAFSDAIEFFTNWGITRDQWQRVLTRFVGDVEQSWLTNTPALSDI